MSKHSRFFVLSSLLLFMLLASLVFPVTVSADDGTPPPTATEEPAQPPTEEADSVSLIAGSEALEEPAGDAAATEAPVVQESADANGGSLIVDDEAEENSEEMTVGEALEAAPEGTQIVVLNDEGSPEPLATQEAAQIIQSGDPRFTVAGVTYYFMPIGGCGALANCTESATPIQTAIDYLSGTALASPWAGVGATPTDGTIYVEAGTYTENVMIVGNTGWNTGLNKPTSLTLSGAGSSTTTLDGWFSIVNMNTFTLSGFTIRDADTSGNPTSIIALGNTGVMTLSDLNVTNTADDGITISNHNGDITLTAVTSNDNAGDGAYLDNSSGSGSINITSTTGSSTFSDNGSDGIEAYSNGNITLTGVTADSNGASGVEAYSNGDITLESVTANGNAENGALLDNFLGSGNVTVTSSTFGVDDGVSGNGIGLFVFASGNTTLRDVTANGNSFNGATLLNVFGGTILIVDSHFDDNARGQNEGAGYGLAILSMGSVRLEGVSASNNKDTSGNGIGASIGAFDVVIQDSVFEGNGYDGLSVGGEDLTIVCSQFINNGGVGVEGTGVQNSLTFNDVTFNGNGEGEYLYNGTPVMQSGGCTVLKNSKRVKFHTSLPLHIVPVGGGEQIGLDCSAYSGTKLILPNDDRVILPCPIRDHGVLIGKTVSQLPAPLNGPFGFASALEVQVIRNGEMVVEVNGSITIDFVIPEGGQGANLAILRWDAAQSQWVEVPGVKTGDGRFMATSNFTGIYILVTK